MEYLANGVLFKRYGKMIRKSFVQTQSQRSKPKMTMGINPQQVGELTKFMELHPDLARGILNRADGRHNSNKLWDNIKERLNEKGPPMREVKEWKKVWADYKYNVKNKLQNNLNSIRKTGGGPNEIKNLNPFEESVVRSAGLEAAVNGVNGTKAFGANSNNLRLTSSTETDEGQSVDSPQRMEQYTTEWLEGNYTSELTEVNLVEDTANDENENQSTNCAPFLPRRRMNYKAEKLKLFKRYVEALEESNSIQRELLSAQKENCCVQQQLLEFKRRKYCQNVSNDSD
ncbi:uncharacterized protein LOC131687327 [Topomyia yanbarensis]|uniref:uncharacterized protein LOC131687327 n=1 Tax=Topomyia yanbarensis TaxID=2498891 RepID=UPI00273C63BE|nr:uncharacterized protein LOC131687327 [Topomyia yanbarensis]